MSQSADNENYRDNLKARGMKRYEFILPIKDHPAFQKVAAERRKLHEKEQRV